MFLFCRPLPEIKWAKKGAFLPSDIEYDNYGKTLKINNVDFEGNRRLWVKQIFHRIYLRQKISN